MTSSCVIRLKVEPGHADDGDDDDLHENKCQPLAALTEDAELNAVVKDCQAQWGVWCQTGHPLEHLRQSLQQTKYRKEVLKTLFLQFTLHPPARHTARKYSPGFKTSKRDKSNNPGSPKQ